MVFTMFKFSEITACNRILIVLYTINDNVFRSLLSYSYLTCENNNKEIADNNMRLPQKLQNENVTRTFPCTTRKFYLIENVLFKFDLFY